MKHKAVKVSRYKFTSEDKLFLDANIWLYLHGPHKPAPSWVVNIYSKTFRRILKAKSQIYIDVLVLSEFINRYARMKCDLVAPNQSFKDFRNSSHFKPVAQDIAADTKLVLQHCSRIENGFATLAIDDLITDYAAGNSDFNDQVITEICRSNGLTLITNDGDFKSQEIPILTANKSLLN